MNLPLKGIRVVEIGHALAGPYAATMLGDFGAEIIKIERPDGGDSLRNMGPKHEGTGVWWSVAARNKKSVALDIKHPDGLRVARDLIKTADVLVENFRPGVLDKMGLGWDDMHAMHPRLIMLRISGFGQTGPYSRRRGFGTIGLGFSGATNLTGPRGGTPVNPGYSLADTVCGLTGAFGVLIALRARELSGEGQLVDLALYESLFRMIEWQIPLLTKQGVNAERNGSHFPFSNAFLTGLYKTTDGAIATSAATLDQLDRLRQLVKDEGLVGGANADGDAISDALERYVAKYSVDEALRKLEEKGLVAGKIFTPRDMVDDPHMASRGNIEKVAHPGGGTIEMPSVCPSMTGSPGAIRWSGPALGEHTEDVLREVLKMDDAQLRQLAESGVTSREAQAAAHGATQEA